MLSEADMNAFFLLNKLYEKGKMKSLKCKHIKYMYKKELTSCGKFSSSNFRMIYTGGTFYAQKKTPKIEIYLSNA